MHRRRLILASAALIVASFVLVDPALAKSSIGIGGGEMAPSPASSGILGAVFVEITAYQREFFTLLRHALVDLKTGGTAPFFLVGLSFAYGIFHAAGPGHGKAVISSYIAANRVQLKRGIVICVASSLVQAFSAITIVGAGWFLLRGSSISMTAAADAVEIASYALVAVFGGWLLVRKLTALLAGRRRNRTTLFDLAPAYELQPAYPGNEAETSTSFTRLRNARPAFAARSTAADGSFGSDRASFSRGAIMPAASGALAADVCTDDAEDCGCGRSHMPDPASLKDTMTLASATAAVFAIGLRPCAGAVVVLTFALVNGLYLAGLFSVLAMALGTAVTVSAIACFAVFARNAADRIGGNGRKGRALSSAIEIGSAAFMLLIGLVLLAAALQG